MERVCSWGSPVTPPEHNPASPPVKISTLPSIYRNVNRLTEILSVLSKYGLAGGLSRLNLDFVKGLLKNRDGEAIARHTRERRIRLAIEELGPTFVKLGQILSTRPDLVGRTLAAELRSLLDETPRDPPEVVRATVENELGQPLQDLFEEFDEVPIASASIGQVHRARLKSGQQVVVKVQHAGIHDVVRKDLDVLSGLAQLAERLPELAAYRPVETVAEFQRSLRRELDFGREERNLQHFFARFHDNPKVEIPQPISELCTPRVLTMEMLEGTKLSELNEANASRFDLEEIARCGAELYLEMIFADGFFHADPHPANVMILPGNRIGLLDFGMVGRVDERLREDIEDLLLALINQDAVLLTSLIIRIGSTPLQLDRSALQNDLADYVAIYGNQPLDRFVLSDALEEMIDMIFRYRIVLPAQVTMILKVFVTLEGTSQLLLPRFSLMQVIQRYQRKALLRRLSPARRVRKLRRLYAEVEHLVESLPRRTMEILDQINAGKFDVHLDHRGLEPSVNRLVLGMLASALFMGSSLMLSRRVPPILFPSPSILGLHEISILGLSGCALSFLLGLRLLRAIGKSGHLDRRDK
jgi:ubiquinone biosynthesis protein